jgi:predicted nucleic acid-binding protein
LITALDSSVLSDIFRPDPLHQARSAAAVRRCTTEGSLIACDVVWAEITSAFPITADGEAAMLRLGVEFDPSEVRAALIAGGLLREHRSRGGQRTRIAADFLIGAHALSRADRLLTRDRGFYRTYFADLTIIDPTTL